MDSAGKWNIIGVVSFGIGKSNAFAYCHILSWKSTNTDQFKQDVVMQDTLACMQRSRRYCHGLGPIPRLAAVAYVMLPIQIQPRLEPNPNHLETITLYLTLLCNFYINEKNKRPFIIH